jgi:hypothetical protein
MDINIVIKTQLTMHALYHTLQIGWQVVAFSCAFIFMNINFETKGKKVAIQNVLSASSDEWHFRVVLALILVVCNLVLSVFRLVGVSCLRIQFYERFWPCETIYLKHLQWYHIIPWPLWHMFELINFEDPILKNDISPNVQLNSLFSFRFFWGKISTFWK